jgi:hypothetical protein
MTRQSTGLLALALVALTVLAGPAATLDGMGVATAAGNTALAAGNTAAGTGTTTADAADAEWRTLLEGSVAATPTVVDGTAHLANGTSLTALDWESGSPSSLFSQ